MCATCAETEHFKLDEALLDRFYAVVPVPDLQKGTTSETFKKVIKMNLREQNLSRDEMKRLINRIRAVYRVLSNNSTIINAVSEYVSNYMEILLNKIDSYISPRKTMHLVEEILGFGSFFRILNQDDFLEEAAKSALIYVLGIPFKIKPEVLMQVHSNLKQLLLKKTIDTGEKIRIELAKLSDNRSMIKYVKKNVKRIKNHLPFDETDKLLAQIIERSADKDLPLLRDMLEKIHGHEEQKRVVQTRIIFYEIKAVDRIQKQLTRYKIYNDQDFETFDRVKSFVQKLKKLPLHRRIERIIFEKEVDYKKILKLIQKGGLDASKTETGTGL